MVEKIKRDLDELIIHGIKYSTDELLKILMLVLMRYCTIKQIRYEMFPSLGLLRELGITIKSKKNKTWQRPHIN